MLDKKDVLIIDWKLKQHGWPKSFGIMDHGSSYGSWLGHDP